MPKLPYRNPANIKKFLGVKLYGNHLDWVKRQAKIFGTQTRYIETLIQNDMEKNHG